LKILVPEGETGKVGATIAVIGAKGEKVEVSAPAAKAPAPAPAPAPAKPAAAKPSAQPEARRETPQPEERAQKPGGPAQVVPIRRSEEPSPPAQDDGRLRASPLAKRMARDEGLDLSAVQGSGPSGRIVKRDVEAAIGQGGQAVAAARAPAPRPGPAPAPAPVFGRREPEVLPISGMRKYMFSSSFRMSFGIRF
jgi:pyruvate dehydrogenase E2 component (dihydrolipoamide acetyltransferase)